MTTTFFEELKDQIHKGVHEKGHPFRFGVLGTVDSKHTASLRTVVIRNVSDTLNLTFYTDARSNKLVHIKENNQVSLLFYNPDQLLQIKVEGLASIISDEAILKKYWSGIPPNLRKDYTTQIAPGSSISNPNKVECLKKENHFCMVEIEPFSIEYLKLNTPYHTKVQFSKKENIWHGEFLVP